MDQRFEKWDKWIDTIYYQAVELVTKCQIFERVKDIICQNPNIQKPSSFWSFLEHTYIAYSVMAVRRQIKFDGNSISLVRLLEEIIETPCVMSRERFVGLYINDSHDVGMQESMRDHANAVFDREFSGRCKNYIDPAIVHRDLSELKSHGGKQGKLEEFADRLFAHRDKRESRIPTFEELNTCVDCLQKLTRKYRLLIQAQGAGDCLVIKSIGDYSEEIFRQPWIISD